MLPDRHSWHDSRQIPRPASLLLAAALAASAACSDRPAPTDPVAAFIGDTAALAQARPRRPTISSISLATTTLVIGGRQVGYTVVVQNPSFAMSNVQFQAAITQGTTTLRYAGGYPAYCPPDAWGVVPNGTCTMADVFVTGASNSAAGSGTLVPGAATFVLTMYQNSGNTPTLLDVKTVPITLVAPPSFTSFALSTTTIPISGPQASWTATVQNPGPNLPDVILQAQITQNGTTYGGGGTTANCPSTTSGTLPTTTGCTMTQLVAVSSLVPGPATFVLELIQSDGQGGNIVFDTRTVDITLVASSDCFPNLPHAQLALESATSDGVSDHFELDVPNYSSFPDALFAPAPDLPACGLNTSASRTWVDILNAADGSYVYGFCSLGSAADLNGIWFQVPHGTAPSQVYIRLTDRKCGFTYASAPIDIPAVAVP